MLIFLLGPSLAHVGSQMHICQYCRLLLSLAGQSSSDDFNLEALRRPPDQEVWTRGHRLGWALGTPAWCQPLTGPHSLLFVESVSSVTGADCSWCDLSAAFTLFLHFFKEFFFTFPFKFKWVNGCEKFSESHCKDQTSKSWKDLAILFPCTNLGDHTDTNTHTHTHLHTEEQQRHRLRIPSPHVVDKQTLWKGPLY